MQPSFSTLSTHSTQIRPFGSGTGTTNTRTRIMCESSPPPPPPPPQQPSAPLSSSMCATGVNNTVRMIRPM